MGHLIKYRMLQTIRKKSQMFWALAFPIILGTFFYISFGSGEMGEDMEAVPTALVIQDKDSDTAKAFTEYMDRLDGSAVQITHMTDEEAEKALRQDKVEGIFYCTEEPALTVAGSGISQSILKSLLDSYCKNASMIMSGCQGTSTGSFCSGRSDGGLAGDDGIFQCKRQDYGL